LRWPRDTLYPLKLALTSPTSGGRSVGIVRLRTQAMEFFFSMLFFKRPSFTPISPLCISFESHVQSYTYMGTYTQNIYVFKMLGSHLKNEAHDITNENINAWVACRETHVLTVTKAINWNDATVKERSWHQWDWVTLLVNGCRSYTKTHIKVLLFKQKV
jgi:hypothetical protein